MLPLVSFLPRQRDIQLCRLRICAWNTTYTYRWYRYRTPGRWGVYHRLCNYHSQLYLIPDIENTVIIGMADIAGTPDTEYVCGRYSADFTFSFFSYHNCLSFPTDYTLVTTLIAHNSTSSQTKRIPSVSQSVNHLSKQVTAEYRKSVARTASSQTGQPLQFFIWSLTSNEQASNQFGFPVWAR